MFTPYDADTSWVSVHPFDSFWSVGHVLWVCIWPSRICFFPFAACLVGMSKLSLVLEECLLSAFVENGIMWSSSHILKVCWSNCSIVSWPFRTVAIVMLCILFSAKDVGVYGGRFVCSLPRGRVYIAVDWSIVDRY